MEEKKFMIQDFETVENANLLDTVAKLKMDGYRLVQACCTVLEEGLQVLYTFDKDHVLHNLKLDLPKEGAEVMSITGVYWAAFIYENEMHDLFGVTFKHSQLDYGGHFFKVAKPTPWLDK